MKKHKFLYSLLLSFIFISSFSINVFAADPKLISTIDSAFKKIESYIVKISTPAAAVAVGTGVLMKKFSFRRRRKNCYSVKSLLKVLYFLMLLF